MTETGNSKDTEVVEEDELTPAPYPTGQVPGEVHVVAPRDPNGLYLDDISDVKAELRRAELEGREPELDDLNQTAVRHVIPTIASADASEESEESEESKSAESKPEVKSDSAASK